MIFIYLVNIDEEIGVSANKDKRLAMIREEDRRALSAFLFPTSSPAYCKRTMRK